MLAKNYSDLIWGANVATMDVGAPPAELSDANSSTLPSIDPGLK
jgi:hypothetical protein